MPANTRKWTMPLRQIAAHDGFMVRRLLKEGLGFAAVSVGRSRALPQDLRRLLLTAGAEATRSYPQAHIALGRLLLEQGKASEALVVLEWAIASASERLQQPLVPLMAPGLLRALRVPTDARRNFDEATRLAVLAAQAAGERARQGEILRLREVMLDDAEAAVTRLELAAEAGQLPELAGEALALFRAHPELPAALALGLRALRESGDPDEARALALAERHRFPTHAPVWRHAMELSAEAGDDADARQCLDRLLRIAPDRDLLAPLWLDPVVHPRAIVPDSALTPELALEALEVAPGGTTLLRVALPGEPAPSGLQVIVLAPHGLGVTPELRVTTLEQGQATVLLRAHRPDRVNLGQPWRVRVVVTDGHRAGSAEVALRVPDPDPGEVLVVVTDDHELYDGRTLLTPDGAQRVLVDKALLCNEIAEAQGASWGYMVEACAIHLLDWAAERGGPAWQRVAGLYRDALVDSVASGHDLGLHLHAFYDPESPEFGQELDPSTGALRTTARLQFATIAERRFWHRAYPQVGSWGDPRSKRGSLLRGLSTLEGLGRLADPGFRVTLFRAGSYDIGKTPEAIRGSLFAVRDAGILADSDVTKGRLYHRFDRETNYQCVDYDPRRPAGTLLDAALLELVPEYNIEGDFLADADVLNAYLDGRLAHLAPGGEARPGVAIVTSMTHTKFINYRRGLERDTLDRSFGDWPVIEAHLAHARERGVRVVTLREAVDAAVHDGAPEPVLVRTEEQIVAADGPNGTCELRFPLRALGAGIPLGAGALIGAIRPPSWAAALALSAEVLEGERVVARRDGGGFDPLVFWLDDRGSYELRVTVPATLGIYRDGDRLRAALPFRRAHVVVDGALHRDVTFQRSGAGAEADLAHP